MQKRAISDDVFTSPMEAVARAMELGLGPSAHVVNSSDGQGFYMPGSDHDAYVARMAEIGGQLVDDEGEELEPGFERAIAAILAAVSKRSTSRETGVILKADDEERIVWGWASISTINGEIVTDKQGDQIKPETMRKAATQFMLSSRMAKAMHEGEGIGEVVHSFPLTKEVAQLLGIYSPIEGWIVAMKVHSEEVWKRVKSGELKAFSIGGKGKRRAL